MTAAVLIVSSMDGRGVAAEGVERELRQTTRTGSQKIGAFAMRSALLMLIGCVLGASTCSGQPAAMEMIPLKWVEPAVLLAMLDGEPPTPSDMRKCRQYWVDGLAQKVARGLPQHQASLPPRWYYQTSVVSAPAEQVRAGGRARTAGLHPAGIASILVIPQQNALLASGTPAAMDELREIVALLDVKPRMVNVEVTLLDAPAERSNEWGIDFGTRVGDLVISSRGNAPPAGLHTRFRRGNLDVQPAWDQRQASGEVATAVNVTTTNNFPAILTMGRLMPFFTSTASYDQFGNRIVTTQTDAVFIGTELFVQPRINRNDTITMILRPTFIEAAGTIVGSNGAALPITETVGTETQVTVRDGETVQIGGFERALREYNTRFAGMLMGRNVSVESHPRLFVTARIVREAASVTP